MKSIDPGSLDIQASDPCMLDQWSANTIQWRWLLEEGLHILHKESADALCLPKLIKPNERKSFEDRIHPDDTSQIRELFENTNPARRRFEFKMRIHLNKNDGYCTLLVSGRIAERDAESGLIEILGTAKPIPSKPTLHHFQQRNDRLSRLASSTAAGFWDWDLQNDQEWWSPSMYQLLGYKSGEIQIDYRRWIDEIVFDEDRAQVKLAIDHALKEQASYRAEFRMRKKDGSCEWFESRGKITEDKGTGIRYFTGSCINIEDRVQMNRIREHETFLLREASRIGQVGFWELNSADQTVIWSEVVYRIHGVEKSQDISLQNAVSFYLEEDIPIVEEAVERGLETGEPFDFEARIRSTDNRIKWVRATGEPIRNSDEGYERLRGVFQDITRQKEYELNILEANRKLASHNERLTQFSHIVSHNLRAHSGNLKMTLELIKEASKSELGDYLDVLGKISNSLSTTMSRLNEITDIQRNVDLKLTTLHLQEIVNNVTDALIGDIRSAAAMFDTDFNNCETVVANPSYLQSVFQNLIGNAIKYRHPDRAPLLRISSERTRTHWIIRIADNGLGIDLTRHGNKIFGLHNVFHRHPEAKGVGLFITKTQIEAMNGTIEIESKPDEGSTFIIRLPRL